MIEIELVAGSIELICFNLPNGVVPNMPALDNGNLDGVNGNESGSYGIYSYWNDNMLINENTINMNLDPNRFGIII